MAPEIPQDILDKIIDGLHDDPAALAACSLSGYPLLQSSHSHLFRTITLKPPSEAQVASGTENLCEKFHRLICSSPNVTKLVRQLVILGSDAYQEEYGDRLRQVTWVDSGPALPAVLEALSNSDPCLESLVVSGHDGALKWALISRDLQDALLGVLQVPSLRHVTFYRFYDYPRSTLALFKGLESLKLVDSFPYHYTDFPTTVSSSFPLHSLTITKTMFAPLLPLLEWICTPFSPFDLSNLKQFHFDFEQQLSDVSVFMAQLRPSLEEFYFHLDCYGQCTPSVFHRFIFNECWPSRTP